MIDIYFVKENTWNNLEIKCNNNIKCKEGVGGVFIDNDNLLIFGGCDIDWALDKSTYIINM